MCSLSHSFFVLRGIKKTKMYVVLVNIYLRNSNLLTPDPYYIIN